ncbi:uncharacterized protein LOC123475246 isoform X2 [Daphnia magna]|uniref:Uncharacterized protein n=1 Tax=Daphnia magna TaxID=35525 RepID=A0ABR0B2S5_9CRUS|nr:uncharacterized protein LOC123475246 isoform X2 [Daphnia magna]KAK4036003.1 hypothetical protein OUZ56_028076 [Daphnia magna]
MSMILLTILSGSDFITGLISIIVQAVIIVNHDDCFYSKMKVGLWNGLLLVTTATSLFVIASRKKPSNWMLVICALTLMASLVQVGVALGVIYELHSLQYFPNGPAANGWDAFLGIFKSDNILTQIGKHAQVHLCYKLLLNDDYLGSRRKTLEKILLCSGLIAIAVKIATFLALRVKRLAVPATIQYTPQNVALLS